MPISVENVIIGFIFSIIAPIFYIKLEHGFITAVINKLTTPNFEINFKKIINLFIGYGTGSILFIYIFKELIEYSSMSLENTNVHTTTMPLLALSFCYLARIITRQRGHSYGQLYINVVVILSSIIFLINIIIVSGIFNTDLLTVLHTSCSNIYNILKSLLLFIQFMIPTLLIGNLIMICIGELIIFKTIKPDVRSIPTVLEKFPSDFLVITGNNRIEKQMYEMTKQQNLFSIKCITNTYKVFDVIQPNLDKQIIKFKNNINDLDFKIMGPSREDSQQYIKNTQQTTTGKCTKYFLNKILPGYIDFKNNNSINEIKNSTSNIEKMVCNGEIKHKEANFGKFRMLLVNNNEILFTISSINNDKIGLYSKEKYIIQICTNLFDSEWN